MENKIWETVASVKRQNPLIHCITNPISINMCANAILALGARPVMAEHPKEVAEITSASRALMLNMGNITDARMESLLISAKTAKQKGIPFLLDVVGIACSSLRREYAHSFLGEAVPSLIKGNYSEIKALYNEKYFSPGVDALPSLDVCGITKISEKLAKKYKTVILATGKTDVITDGARAFYIKNGTPYLASVTGTGCMLGSMCAAFMATATTMDAGVSACAYLGICGELSKTDKGAGSFMVNLMDKISTLKKEEIKTKLKIEEV